MCSIYSTHVNMHTPDSGYKVSFGDTKLDCGHNILSTKTPIYVYSAYCIDWTFRQGQKEETGRNLNT